MQVLQNIEELKTFRESLGMQSVGLVPTMGALHKGHLSLISESIHHNTHTIVSIFVNPTQFGQNEDLSTYPRTLDRDLALCESLGVSAVFVPSVEQMYPSDDEIAILPPKMMGYVLEGFDRPTHFAGVLQVVLKLFMLARPHKAYFGKKDAQQVLIVQKMAKDLHLPLEIVMCPIVRDDDGLAFSSRNVYLSPKEREIALCIPRTITRIESAIAQGVREVRELENLAHQTLDSKNAPIHIFYAYFCDHSLAPITHIRQDESLFLLAVRVGKTRLLDNLWC
ncbi:pantoate--beta-alanine ligase [uncultured Helicobacter sp.]|uniref:pantoate--beta-alanine ligase n=1 Tax=uncultured Helicobacter sp. TaxID=175537 RepID=UPI00374F347A